MGADLVVGIGGGRPLDSAKAIAALVANGGDPLDYMEVIGKGLPLTKREKELAEMLLLGRTRPQISTELFISPETVKKHIANIYRKLGIRSRVELAMLLMH